MMIRCANVWVFTAVWFIGCSTALAQAVEWGDSVEGVQLHLNAVPIPADAPPLTAMNLPQFQVQVRNQSGLPIAIMYEGMTLSAHIEIDGNWYGAAWGGSCCSMPQNLLSGKDSGDFPMKFDYRNLYELSPGNKGIDLKPGKHSIRFRTSDNDRFAVSFATPPHRIVLISNRVTIEVPDVSVSAEREALIATVSKGGTLPGVAVRQLVEKYPDAALGALQTAIQTTDIPFIRGELISWLGTVPGEDVSAYLRLKLTPNTDFASRAAALWALFQRKDPSVISAAVVAWRDIQPTLRAWNPDSIDMASGTRYAAGRIMSVLGESMDADAIDSLARSLSQNSVDVRLAALRLFLPRATNGSLSSGVSIVLNGEIGDLPGGPAGLAIERLLAAGLADREQRKGISGNYNDFSYKDPRVCDIAALVFSTRWPSKYRFRWSDVASERDTQIDAIRNLWRAEHPF